jgi:hypothetical protein
MSRFSTVSEKIVESVYTGVDPVELQLLDGITASAAELNITDGLTATTAELNAAADLSARTVVVPAGGAATVLPAGGAVVLSPLVTANVTATLPATPTAGMTYTFIYTGTAADAEDWVLTAAAFFKGGVCWLEEDSAGVEVASIYANGTTHNTITVNNPAAGTRLDIIGDGVTWSITGMVVSADTPAFSAV